MIRFEIHDAVACAILFLWHPIHASDEGPSAQALSKSGQKAELKDVNIEENGEAEPVALKAMRKIAAGCSFLIKAEEAKRAFGLRKEPLLKYADDQIAVAASTLWVWMDGEIPAFFQKIEVNNYGGGSQWTYCFANGNSSPVECEWTEARRKGITTKPIALSPVPGNPEADLAPPALSFAARQISQQFSAKADMDLNLMPRPLMEFKAEKQNVPYGAVFAFASGSNPSMLLIIQLEETSEGKRWMYRPVHMTSLEVTLSHDGKLVWKDPQQMSGEVSTWGYFFSRRDSTIK